VEPARASGTIYLGFSTLPHTVIVMLNVC
jgi:hypothetical protein